MDPFPQDIRLAGPLKPMRFEVDIEDCVVQGEIPKDLNGGFYRCGPSMKRPTRQNFVGLSAMDGMVQAMIFENGKATFRNRWVRTPKYLAEEKAGEAIFEYEDAWADWRGYGLGEVVRDNRTAGVPQGNAGVNVVPFAGKEILALCEQGLVPVALDPITLETKGLVPWADQCGPGLVNPPCPEGGTFTAHPKWDPDTGELFGWSGTDKKPFCTLHFVKPDGTVKSRVLDDAPYYANLHDIWLTEEYVVMPFMPFINTLERIKDGNPVLGWEPERPIVLGIIPRSLEGDIRWIEAGFGPEYIMHTMSANTDGNTLTLDGPIFDKAPFPFEQDLKPGDEFIPFGAGVTGRWIVDLEAGSVKSERLDDRPVEFPKIDERFYGKSYETGFMTGGDDLWSLTTLIKRNVRKNKEERFTIEREAPIAIFEPTFAPRNKDAGEADGYMIVPVSRFTENLSDYLIFDTSNIEAGPVATIELPVQIGWTPHGHYMDFETKFH